MDLLPELQDLLKRWRVGAKIYSNNIQEAKEKGLDVPGMIGNRDSLLECVKELERVVKIHE